MVPTVDEGADLRVEVLDGGEDSAANGLAFDNTEPDLHQVNLRLTGVHRYRVRGPVAEIANIALGGQQ